MSDLIYDVGVNNGDDTAYYLKSGFRVVGIEANPVMVSECEQRFAIELDSGQLTLLNLAIADQDGVVDFYVSEGNRGVWSSLDASLGGRTGALRCVQVPARRFRSLLDEYGVPYYLKVDIEGADYLCLRDLDIDHAPTYVSFEASENHLETLFWLAHAGYTRFRLINQLEGWVPMMPPPLHSVALTRRLALDLARRSLRRIPGLAPAARALRALKPKPPEARHAAPAFSISSSGPHPGEVAGAWWSLEEVTYAWLYYVRPTTGGPWYDVHATR